MTTAPLGPVMLDVEGVGLNDADHRRLSNPLVGGVILFKRNYVSPEQIVALTDEIRALRSPPLLIAVDHEGGRVQRFRDGFTLIPAMAELGASWDIDRSAARARAEAAGVVLASELAASGVDFSFTPVLDLDFGRSAVIGNRALHRDAEAVADLAGALIAGLARAGFAAVGKHFPGHGFAAEDSHAEIPTDPRPLAELRAMDLVPYDRLRTQLAGVMPAHVIYPAVDRVPAGFSRIWLQDILRGELAFDGVIFSDDLSMEGATVAGDIAARAGAALSAGCDMVLVCNRPDLSDRLLDTLIWTAGRCWADRLTRMRSRRPRASLERARAEPAYQAALRKLQREAIGSSSRPTDVAG